jgi:hypothetical protein
MHGRFVNPNPLASNIAFQRFAAAVARIIRAGWGPKNRGVGSHKGVAKFVLQNHSSRRHSDRDSSACIWLLKEKALRAICHPFPDSSAASFNLK